MYSGRKITSQKFVAKWKIMQQKNPRCLTERRQSMAEAKCPPTKLADWVKCGFYGRHHWQTPCEHTQKDCESAKAVKWGPFMSQISAGINK